jgi:hypothetical protein
VHSVSSLVRSHAISQSGSIVCVSIKEVSGIQLSRTARKGLRSTLAQCSSFSQIILHIRVELSRETDQFDTKVTSKSPIAIVTL